MSDYLKDEAERMERDAAKELDRELERGDRLAKQLVFHLKNMGGAASATLPVEFEGEKWEIIVRQRTAEGKS